MGFHDFRAAGHVHPVFRTVGAVEWDQAAAATYAANFSAEAGGVDYIHAGDISDYNPVDLGEKVDVVLGGPPCQGFSALNKNNLTDIKDPRNRLWREYARIVNLLKPKLFVIENVDRFLKSPEFFLLESATKSPGGLLRDYKLTDARVLNSADYGVPQARRRAIVLGTRRDVVMNHPDRSVIDYPAATHAKISRLSSLRSSDALPYPDIEARLPWQTVESIFKRTSPEADGTGLPEIKCAPLGEVLPGAYRTYELHVGRNPTEISKRRYEKIPEGGNRDDLLDYPELTTDSWRRHTKGSGDVMGRLHIDRPSVTIRTEFYKPEKGRYLHPTAHRPITHLEAALIQGFPEDYLWCGSKVKIARQIGNAVPVGLATALAGSVYEYLAAVGAVSRRQASGDGPTPA